jgi:hypothetical protein
MYGLENVGRLVEAASRDCVSAWKEQFDESGLAKLVQEACTRQLARQCGADKLPCLEHRSDRGDCH